MAESPPPPLITVNSCPFQILLSEAPIEPAAAVFGDEEGAECQFLGTVRHMEDGKRICGIDYSAYRPMADQELQRLCERAQREHPGHRVYLQHRLGFVAAQVPSIVIRVTTKHSAASFELCQWYLGAIKTRVPIWKKPVWESTGAFKKPSGDES
ncbi:molybdenum cofactor biosynthesis protein MoaE [Phragmitibacter flavus]|uniref:Molybdopterin synthase catalytic subunit n=1 Tax=Phragmitibacter flavus TaxID=2576071 RepID=A0A5R8KK19_9BACT|nr:molybdenum cofactor biosynthesis protein MoaE [Phragmitibacter flavus]TLD72664.1 molybdenum cofactor biosynthesis protein MoaE [Phragmitibacter flavus]